MRSSTRQQRPRWHHTGATAALGGLWGQFSPGQPVDHTLRRRLIEALKARSWTSLDAERAAVGITGFYEGGTGEWKVRLSKIVGEPDFYQVGRKVNEIPVFDSPLEGRARDVAGALNELEGDESDATGTH